MSTMGRAIVDRLIAGDGWLPEHPDHDAPDNPRAELIVEYTDQGGKLAYGVTFSHESGSRQERYLVESAYIREPRVFWKAPRR
jgi:hypothetical protein